MTPVCHSPHRGLVFTVAKSLHLRQAQAQTRPTLKKCLGGGKATDGRKPRASFSFSGVFFLSAPLSPELAGARFPQFCCKVAAMWHRPLPPTWEKETVHGVSTRGEEEMGARTVVIHVLGVPVAEPWAAERLTSGARCQDGCCALQTADLRSMSGCSVCLGPSAVRRGEERRGCRSGKGS